MRQYIGIVVAFLVCVSSTAHATDWLSYLNGRDRAGFTNAKLPSELKLAWTYRAPAKPQQAWSGPRLAPIEGHEMRHRVDFDSSMQVVIQGDRAYFGNTVDHSLHCVDATTGKLVWKFYTDGPIRLAPTIAHDSVYFGSDDGIVYCLDQASGKKRWSMRLGPKDDRLLSRGEMISRWPVRTGVLVDEDVAYFGAGLFPHENIFLCAANAKTGEVIWRNDTISQQNAGRNDLSPQGYLLANDKFLYVPSGRSLPVAISKKTGDIVFQRKHSWRTDAGGVVGGTKALLGDGQVYSGGPHHFLAMDERNGSVGESWIGGRQMVLASDQAYLMDGEKIFCVDRSEHARASQEKQKWFLRARQDRKDPKKVKLARKKMKEYAGVGVIWQFPSEFDDALIATDKYVVAAGLGKVIILDRESGKEVWQTSVTGNVTGLAATDSLLTVSTDLGHIYGFRSQSDAAEPANEWPVKSAAFADDEQTEFYRSAAAKIIEQSGHKSGYCLVVGSEDGHLAHELAIQSSLNVLAIEPDAEKARKSRESLERSGIHATQVTIINCPIDEIPFSNYFANLIVSQSHLTSGNPPCDAKDVARFLKPCGGVAMIGVPDKPIDSASQSWTSDLLQEINGEITRESNWLVFQRGQLPGAGEWSHQYGNAANTSVSDDQLVRDGLGVLWYGDPGPSSMINRHEASGAPLSTNGRMFIQGIDSVMAYDAYNGNFLWEFKNPGAIRTGVFNNRETHNLAASEDTLYVAIEGECVALEASSGNVIAKYKTPKSPDGLERAWAYLAYDDDQVFGTSTIREELEKRLRRRGLTVKTQTDAIFAVDAETGERAWTYRGSNILHTTIAIGPQHVYFIDSAITPEQRQELYLSDKGDLKKLEGDAAKKAEADMKRFDARLAVALDRKTGKKVWERPVDVTDTTNVSSGGGSLTVMYADGHVVLCGANANGHYWKQFLSGKFEKRKLLVLDAETGDKLWSKNANYMNRPAVIGDEIYAEPWAFKLATGEPKTRKHPVTGVESTWRFSRPGHHCGVITATPNMMFFRSGFIGYYDLYRDSGTKHFSGQRLGCWVNAIPGNGLVMIPEASAGCVCQFSIASTVVLEPKTESKSWGIFSAVGKETPVQRLAINLGAPGDRMDKNQNEWFGFPRPSTRGRLEYELNIKPRMANGGGWFSRNASHTDYSQNDTPWIYASGARGLVHFEANLIGAGEEPGDYLLKMHFAKVSADDVRKLDFSIQGQSVKADLVQGPIVGKRPVQIIQLSATVKDRLAVDIQYPESGDLPELCAIEILRQSESASTK